MIERVGSMEYLEVDILSRRIFFRSRKSYRENEGITQQLFSLSTSLREPTVLSVALYT